MAGIRRTDNARPKGSHRRRNRLVKVNVLYLFSVRNMFFSGERRPRGRLRMGSASPLKTRGDQPLWPFAYGLLEDRAPGQAAPRKRKASRGSKRGGSRLGDEPRRLALAE